MSDETPIPKVYPSRPRDESLKSFKEWIHEFKAPVTGNFEDDGSIAEDEWVKLWKEFWA
jgi:hypothetical protein